MKLRDIIIIVAIAASIFLLTRLVIQNFVVDGDSMYPNLEDEQQILVYKLDTPKRGDIVFFNNHWRTKATHPLLVKRVIGLPGETVKIESGKVYINGKLLDESSYISVAIIDDDVCVLGEREYYVLGDNRNDSSDSSEHGALFEENIIGRAWLRIWHLHDWGFAPNATPVLAE